MNTRTLTRDELLEVIKAAPKSMKFPVGITKPYEHLHGHVEVRLVLNLSKRENQVYFNQLQAIRCGYPLKEFKRIVEEENRELRNRKPSYWEL